MTKTLRVALALGLVAGLAMSQAPERELPKARPVSGADEVGDAAKLEAGLYASLKEVINKGVDLYNGGDVPGCYRMFEGALRASKALVAHRPKLVDEIESKLAAAEREPASWKKAFALRAALDKVRSEIKPKDAVEPPTIEPPVKKPADDKKKADEDQRKKDAEELDRKLEEELKKSKADEARKKKEEDDKKKDEKKPEAKTIEDDIKAETKVGGAVLKQPKELIEKEVD